MPLGCRASEVVRVSTVLLQSLAAKRQEATNKIQECLRAGAIEGRKMSSDHFEIDCDEIEDTLGLEVPKVLRDFFETFTASGRPRSQYMFADTNDLIRLNMTLEGQNNWSEENLAFAGDGCGNYFFMAGEEDADQVYLRAHDPEGIEPQGDALRFLQGLFRA